MSSSKAKRNIKFNHSERRATNSSSSDLGQESPNEERAKSPNALRKTETNGSASSKSRPDYDRKDTAASEWATENETEDPAKVKADEYAKKKQTFMTRALWTVVMIAGFFVGMFAGHIYMLIAITVVQIVSFKEVIAISNVPSRARSLRFTKTLNWYFLGTTMYFLYGESVIYYFKHIVLIDRVLLPFATHHRFISFMLYVMGA